MPFLFLGKPKSIADLRDLPASLAPAKRSSMPILVIDDEPFPYMELLRNHDFNLKQLPDIHDLSGVQPYEIVLCDIRGVGKRFHSRYEGAHLISEFRKMYPTKIVMAFTGQQFDATFNEYFAKSDFVIKKDAGTEEWVQRLDHAIRLANDPIEQWRRLRNHLISMEVSLFHVVRLEDEYVKVALARRGAFPSKQLSRQLPEHVKNILESFAASLLFKVITGG
jgi:hypothetical protein